MKRFLIALLAAAMLLMLAGCEFSSGMKLMCVETSTSTSWKMSYSKFTGTERETIRTTEPDTRVTVQVVTNAGSLNLKVTPADDPDRTLYQGTDMPTCEFTFNIPEAGKYTVTVTADDHEGSYVLDWSK